MVTLLTILLSISASAGESVSVFPQICQEKCVVPYGTKLGVTEDGVEAFSNCQPKCVNDKPSYFNKEYAGVEWQCVEFARRWLIEEKGLTFESIDNAADLWNKVVQLTNIKTKESKPLKQVLNGAKEPPVPGNLLIYGRDYYDTGHVAVVLRVNRKQQVIYVGEENYSNAAWPGKFSREIPYVTHGKEFWVLDHYLLGWKTY
jgi:glutathionylspermidine amidase/synthetase